MRRQALTILICSGVISGTFYVAYAPLIHAAEEGVINSTVGTSVCGNGIKENGEECDDQDLGGVSCSSFHFSSGNLHCTAACEISTTNCTTVSSNNSASQTTSSLLVPNPNNPRVDSTSDPLAPPTHTLSKPQSPTPNPRSTILSAATNGINTLQVNHSPTPQPPPVTSNKSSPLFLPVTVFISCGVILAILAWWLFIRLRV